MKKIGIITLYADYNYGNRLQNYAVQKIFSKKGYNVDTIINIERVHFRILRLLYKYATAITGNKESKRNIGMMQFNRKRINRVNVLGKRVPEKLINRYDYFVVGSDQVWNPKLKEFDYHRFFLRFCDKEKRICLSPSIGMNSIPSEFSEMFKEGLSGFKYLSCREESGANAIESVCGQRCETLIDPTLALEANEWRIIEETVNGTDKYILLFLLGEKSNVVKEILSKLDSNYKIIDMGDNLSSYYAAKPEQLLFLIDNAMLVITDSFHITAFSINFNVPFYVVNRYDSKDDTNNKMNSRIVTLTNLLGLSERYITQEVNTIDFNCDFSYANKVLPELRKKVDEYIEECTGECRKEGAETY